MQTKCQRGMVIKITNNQIVRLHGPSEVRGGDFKFQEMAFPDIAK